MCLSLAGDTCIFVARDIYLLLEIYISCWHRRIYLRDRGGVAPPGRLKSTLVGTNFPLVGKGMEGSSRQIIRKRCFGPPCHHSLNTPMLAGDISSWIIFTARYIPLAFGFL